MSERLRAVISRLEKSFKYGQRVFEIEQRINFFQKSDLEVINKHLNTSLILYRSSLSPNTTPLKLKLLLNQTKDQSGITYMTQEDLDTLSQWHLGQFDEKDPKKFYKNSTFRKDYPEKARRFLERYVQDVLISYFFSQRENLTTEKRQQLITDLLDFLSVKKDGRDCYQKLSVRNLEAYQDSQVLGLFFLLDQLRDRKERVFFGFEISSSEGFDQAIAFKNQVLDLVKNQELKKFLEERWIELKRGEFKIKDEREEPEPQSSKTRVYYNFSDSYIRWFQKKYPYNKKYKVDFLRLLRSPKELKEKKSEQPKQQQPERLKRKNLVRLLIARLSSDNGDFNWLFNSLSKEQRRDLEKLESIFDRLILEDKDQSFFNEFRNSFFQWLDYQPSDKEKEESFVFSRFLTSKINGFIIRRFFQDFYGQSKRFGLDSYQDFLKVPGVIESILAARKLLVLRLIRDYLPEEYKRRDINTAIINKPKIQAYSDVYNIANYVFSYPNWPSLKPIYNQLKRQDKEVDFTKIDLSALGQFNFSTLLHQLMYFYLERQLNDNFLNKDSKKRYQRRKIFERFLKEGRFVNPSKRFLGIDKVKIMEDNGRRKILFADFKIGELVG